MGYTFEKLRKEGPAFAFEMLLRAIESGEPFVTYDQIAEELERQLDINRLFRVHVGQVAGAMMDQIRDYDSTAPLINVLITNSRGIPGKGAGGYLDRRQRVRARKHPWNSLPVTKKLELVERERRKILRYGSWDDIRKHSFGSSEDMLRPRFEPDEGDYAGGNGRGGPAESKEHKKLKAWVARNPKKIGLSKFFGPGTQEAQLLSGDEVDVLFRHEDRFVVVEVKSTRSSDLDLRRGLYQCVKYRAVKAAELKPYTSNIRTMLITERDLPHDLAARATLLDVQWKNMKNRR